jgi:hypothetical protein
MCRRLLRDGDRDLGRTILIAGAPRSGTTWLAELLESSLSARLMFEPFHARLVPEFGYLKPFSYLRPDDVDDRLFESCHRVFDGSLRNPWVDKNLTTVRPRCRIVKSVRSNLMLAWLLQRFPEISNIFVLRHPCAVVLSRMHYGWNAEDDLASMLGQPRLVEDHLAPYLERIQSATTTEEKHAILWCITNLVPLRQLGHETLKPLYYEHLYSDRANVLKVLGRAVHRDLGNAPQTASERPSRTTTSLSPILRGDDNLRRWQRELSADAVRRILDLVAAFELDWLYGAGLMPMCAGVAANIPPLSSNAP